jgi:hypothetical protein
MKHTILPAAALECHLSKQIQKRNDQQDHKRAAEINTAGDALLDFHRYRHLYLIFFPSAMDLKRIITSRQRRESGVRRLAAFGPGFAVVDTAVILDRHVYRLDDLLRVLVKNVEVQFSPGIIDLGARCYFNVMVPADYELLAGCGLFGRCGSHRRQDDLLAQHSL